MSKKPNRIFEKVEELYQFRAKIPANLTVAKVEEIWNIKVSEDQIPEIIEPRGNIIKEKINIANSSIKWLVIKQFVKFVAISGSVASEFAKKSDDIDLFIVTKNDTVWIYRFYLYFKNFFKGDIRSKNKRNVENKFCINLLTEERFLQFEPDVFNLNEILYLKPIYNHKYQKIFLLNNQWIKDKHLVSEKYLGIGGIKVCDVKALTKRNYFLLPLNFLAFLSQLVYMIAMNHRPDISRLLKGFKKGRVEFYPKDFKLEKLRNLKSH